MMMQMLARQLPPTRSVDVMDMLSKHVPLMLLVDVAFPGDLQPLEAESFA